MLDHTMHTKCYTNNVQSQGRLMWRISFHLRRSHTLFYLCNQIILAFCRIWYDFSLFEIKTCTYKQVFQDKTGNCCSVQLCVSNIWVWRSFPQTIAHIVYMEYDYCTFQTVLHNSVIHRLMAVLLQQSTLCEINHQDNEVRKVYSHL